MGNFANYLIFFVYLILGLYFLNEPFGFLPLPNVNKWFIFVGGILLIIGGTKYFRSSSSIFRVRRNY